VHEEAFVAGRSSSAAHAIAIRVGYDSGNRRSCQSVDRTTAGRPTWDHRCSCPTPHMSAVKCGSSA
jgi:hypothetical protein